MDVDVYKKVVFDAELSKIISKELFAIEYLDKSLLYNEYITTVLKPDINLYFNDVLPPKPDKTTEEYIISSAKLEEETTKEFNRLISQKKLDEKYYSHSIKDTQLYKTVFSVVNIYDNAVSNIIYKKNNYKEETEKTVTLILGTISNYNIEIFNNVILSLTDINNSTTAYSLFQDRNHNSYKDQTDTIHDIKYLNTLLKDKILQSSQQKVTESLESPEYDFSDNEEKIKLKVEMIILKEFGIIDLLTKTQNLTNSETAKRICIILSGKIEKSGLKEPQKYIENILTAIARGNPDVSSDKTPYKKQNIKDALSELTKRGLSIENTTYLKNLKQTHSNLFD